MIERRPGLDRNDSLTDAEPSSTVHNGNGGQRTSRDDGNGNGNGNGNEKHNFHAGVTLIAQADFPTKFGNFVLYGFYDKDAKKEHTAVVKGDVDGSIGCPVRIHSECHTGDVWGSLRCDCRDQLEAALRYIQGRGYGAVIYLKQEGRGIGLINKIKTYQLQDLGLDTVEANEFLGFPAEARNYHAASEILDILGIKSVKLLTNNPDKMNKLSKLGVTIDKRIPLITKTNNHNKFYLETKKLKMGHLY
jgi:GTP cyclohydrolase II